jgi:uncharacterized protein (TIGR03083 family)
MASPLAYLDALHEYQDVFLATIPDADPGAPVPWCGDWTVEDLVVHLARVHHWAAAQARMVQQAPFGNGPFDLVQLYAQCAAELRATLAELDPDARARTLLDDGLPPTEQVGTVRFWHRRQALETLVHAWDLRVACGLDFDPGPAAWQDCFDEVVTIMHPRQIRLGRITAPATRVRFDVEEGPTVWLHGAPADAPEITITGPARSLALLAWGRTTSDDPALTVTGSRAALDELLAAGLTP